MMDRRSFYEARARYRPEELRRGYHGLIQRYFGLLVPPGRRVLEVGCGLGDLLASVRPSDGLGIDISPAMVELARSRHPESPLEFRAGDPSSLPSDSGWDYMLMADLVNDLEDVQETLQQLRTHANDRTRLVISFYNALWRPGLALAEKLGFKAPSPPQNWLSHQDLENLLRLAGWEPVKIEWRILIPANIPILSELLNRWAAPWLKWFCLAIFVVARPRPLEPRPALRCTVVIPARNEAGNIEAAVRRVPQLGLGTEIIFVEGHSSDRTWEEIERVQRAYADARIVAMKQTGKGKGNAVREAFAVATGDLLLILDADLTVAPEDLRKFYEAARSGAAEFINGVRLVYPMERQAMRFLNLIANRFFGAAFTWLLGQRVKDTLCGTKVLFRRDYESIAGNRAYFGDFDPFGDFDLLFGAAKLNLKIQDLPVRYHARTYGETNIQRWRHGWLLLRMVEFAARRLKFL